MPKLEIYCIQLSEAGRVKDGEVVYADIRNDAAVDESGQALYGHEYSYEMFGAQLDGPIPTEKRTGFRTGKEAEDAARQEYKEWRAGNIPVGTTMPRHQVFRTQYRKHRYLEHLNEEELVQRFKDIVGNQTTLTDDLKIGLHPIDQGGDYWSIMTTHILEECVLRKYKYPEPFAYNLKDIQLPDYEWPELRKVNETFKEKNLAPGTYLLKFGKAQYLKPMLEAGLIRIMPASAYDDPSLNPAIRDEELEVDICALPSDVEISVIDEGTGQLVRNIQPLGNITYTFRAHSNYYVYCLSAAFSIRLFGDFEADSCLIIKSPSKFIDRLNSAFLKTQPKWSGYMGNVYYVDPFNYDAAKLNAYFSKHFRYTYQQEFRVIWVPPSPELELEAVFLELGNLMDICELITL